MTNPLRPDKRLYRDILSRGRYTTLALSDGNDPYTLTLHYAPDPEDDIIYFLTDKGGTKLDYLKSDPYVCGTIIREERDRHSSLVFRGLMEVVHKEEEKERIHSLLLSRNLPFLRIQGEDGKERMYLRLVIDEISVRRFP